MENPELEKADGSGQIEEVSTDSKPAIKVDRRGLPLVPQPSEHKDDPLNWPTWQKIYIVLLVSVLAFMAQLGYASFDRLSKRIG